MTDVIARKKLIEVALPLEAINTASAREKSIRHGHPSTLHLWWSRKPLATARAVLFAQLVDDPSSRPNRYPTEEAQNAERHRLFRLIEQLVRWENSANESVLGEARAQIWQSWRDTCADNRDNVRAGELFNPEKLPAFHDPFAGGGSIPLEAQRLGMEAYASDLNPVAVLINKAMIEIPSRLAGMPPVNPDARNERRLVSRQWKGAEGLAEDVRYYGRWMRDQAEKRIGHLYPKVEISHDLAKDRPDLQPLVGRKLTVIAWLWARTVKSPDPAFAHVDVPLVSTFILATKPGKEAYIEPVVTPGDYRFRVRLGQPADVAASKAGTKLSGANFRCLLSGSPISAEYLRTEARAHRMGIRLMAVVAEGSGGRVYLPATDEMDSAIRKAEPSWKPEVEFFPQALGFRLANYGMRHWSDLYTDRQLLALTTLCDLVGDVRKIIQEDADISHDINSTGEQSKLRCSSDERANAICTYLGLAVARYANAASMLCSWNPGASKEDIRFTFSRQALSMSWDFAEGNLFSGSSGNFSDNIEVWIYKMIRQLFPISSGFSEQCDASTQQITSGKVISTDPPYYDNIGYADLSDYFYVWLRRSLRDQYPGLFSTLSTPKAQELVATPARHGGR